MSDQKVTVRVEAQKMGDVSKPFKDVAKEAAGAEKAVKSLGRAQNELQSGSSAKQLSKRGLGFSSGINKSVGAFGAGAGMEIAMALQAFEKVGKAGNDVSGALALLSGNVKDASAAFENGLLGPAVLQTTSAFEQLTAWIAKKTSGTNDAATAGQLVAENVANQNPILKIPGVSAVTGNMQQGLAKEAADKQLLAEAKAQQQIMKENMDAQRQLQRQASMQRGNDEIAGLSTPEEQRKYFRSQQGEAGNLLGGASGRGAAGAAEMEAAQQRILDMAKAEREVTLKLIDDRKKMVDAAKQLLEVEKERFKDSSAQFGAMSAAEQRRSMKIAEKIAGGQDLSKGETAFARGKSFFNESVRNQDAKRGDAAGFEQFAKLLGLDKGVNKANADLAAAEKLKVELETQLKVDLNVDFENAGAALSEKVVEAIQKVMEIQAQRAAAEIARLAETVKAQQRAANPT